MKNISFLSLNLPEDELKAVLDSELPLSRKDEITKAFETLKQERFTVSELYKIYSMELLGDTRDNQKLNELIRRLKGTAITLLLSEAQEEPQIISTLQNFIVLAEIEKDEEAKIDKTKRDKDVTIQTLLELEKAKEKLEKARLGTLQKEDLGSSVLKDVFGLENDKAYTREDFLLTKGMKLKTDKLAMRVRNAIADILDVDKKHIAFETLEDGGDRQMIRKPLYPVTPLDIAKATLEDKTTVEKVSLRLSRASVGNVEGVPVYELEYYA